MTQVEWFAFEGVLVALLAGYAAYKVGFRQAVAAERAHALSVAKATAKVGCQVTVEGRNDLGPGYNPHIYITVKIYNEGELAVQSLSGQWKLLTPNPIEKKSREIHRDFLGHCENYLDTSRIDESANWRSDGVGFDVEVEFVYSVPGESDPKRYHQTYRYARESKQMIQVNA